MKLFDLLLPLLESQQTIEEYWRQNPGKQELLMETSRGVVERAWQQVDTDYDDAIRSLFMLQDDHYRFPLDKKVWNVDHPVFYEIRYRLEQLWETGWLQETKLDFDQIPDGAMEFAQWLRHYCQNHAILSHPLLQYIKERTREELRLYFYYLTTFEVPQNDLYALATVGLPDQSARIEISKNYWDEMGNGDEENCHTAWSARMNEVLNVYDDETPWKEEFISFPLACIERFMTAQYVGSRRKNWGKLIGHLGATEIFDPLLNIKLLHMIRQFGISDYHAEYFIQHIKVDAVHSVDWLHKVVTPIVKEDPDIRLEIARGAELNMYSLYRSFDQILQLLKTGNAHANN